MALVVLLALLSPLRRSRPHDFMIFYFEGRLAADGKISQLYHRSAYEPYIAEMRAAGENLSPIGAYYSLRPAYHAFLCIPLALFPYRVAATLAIIGNLLLMAFLVWKLPVWFPTLPSVRVWLAMFLPFAWSVGMGQDTLLLTLLAAYSIRLVLKDRQGWAGVILALGVYKPHLIWAVPFALMAAGKRRAFWSFAAMSGMLAAVSLGAVGVDGVRDYISLAPAPSSDYKPEIMGNIRAIGTYFGQPAAAAAAILAVVAFGIILRRRTLLPGVSAALLLGPLLSPHTYWQDYSLGALAAMLVPQPLLRVLVLLPWPYLYTRRDMLPMVGISLLFLVVSAVKLPAATAEKRALATSG